jgi:hypothetical protein
LATQLVTFPLWLLFSWEFCPNEKNPCPKTMCWKEFHLFLLPRLRTEVTFLCHCQKVYASQNFVGKHFQICLKYSLHWAVKYSIPMSCPPCCFVRTALDHHTKCFHSWHFVVSQMPGRAVA